MTIPICEESHSEAYQPTVTANKWQNFGPGDQALEQVTATAMLLSCAGETGRLARVIV